MSDLRESLTQSGTLYGFINTIVYAHDYNDLSNKPQINGVTLQGNKTASELGLVTPATESVQSVNGETGAVVLDGNDIAYDNNNTINQQIAAVAASIPVMAVTSVNGETGDVVLDGSDIRYDADYTVSAKIAAVEGDIPVVSYPVTSVNSKTGAVTLTGSDIIYSGVQTLNGAIDSVSEDVSQLSDELSALTAEDIPMSGSDSTPVSTAIGSLSTLTTTVKSSLVGAVNEVNGAITSPKDITSDFITMASGYTFVSGKVYKQGKHIFGNIVLSGTMRGGNSVDTLGTIKSDYRASDEVNSFCGISDGQWFTNNIGYFYINAFGSLQVSTTPTGMSYAKIHIDYVTA